MLICMKTFLTSIPSRIRLVLILVLAACALAGLVLLLYALVIPQPLRILALASNQAENKALELIHSEVELRYNVKVELTLLDGETPLSKEELNRYDQVFYIAGHPDLFKAEDLASLPRDLVTRFPSSLNRFGPDAQELRALPVLADTLVLYEKKDPGFTASDAQDVSALSSLALPRDTLFQILVPGDDFRLMADLVAASMGSTQSKGYAELREKALGQEPDRLLEHKWASDSLASLAQPMATWQKQKLVAPGWLDIRADSMANWLQQFKPRMILSTLANRSADSGADYSEYITRPIANAPLRILSMSIPGKSVHLEIVLKIADLITQPEMQARLASESGLVPAALAANTSDQQVGTIRQWMASLDQAVPTLASALYADYRQNRLLCQEIQALIRRESLGE